MAELNIPFTNSPVHIELPISIHDLIHIEINHSDDNRYRNSNYTRLDAGESISLRKMMQMLPLFSSDNASNEALHLLFPEGIASTLSALKTGILPTVTNMLADKGGLRDFLLPLEGVGAPFNLFSSLSVMTNQYYLQQINQQLRDIQSRLDRVLDFLYNDKECEIYSETMAVLSISRNYTSIMACAEQRTASIQTIQHAKIVAERNIQFYYRDMNKLAKDPGAISKLREDLQYYTQVINLYGLCSTLEIVLSQNYDKAYLDYIESDLKAHVERHIGSVNYLKATLEGKLEAKLKPAPTFPFVVPPKPDPDAQKLMADVSAILGDDSPINGLGNIIKQIRKAFTSKTEYIIESNGAVYRKEMEA